MNNLTSFTDHLIDEYNLSYEDLETAVENVLGLCKDSRDINGNKTVLCLDCIYCGENDCILNEHKDQLGH